jgi:opacity protein-like surface antigen
MKKVVATICIFISSNYLNAQDVSFKKWFMLGMRSTGSIFSDDGFGIGTGGQFRIQFGQRVNSDWFADYISINMNNKVRSEYVHIGWSVLFYPLKNLLYPAFFQPYILAGHCFDYNKKTAINFPDISKDRWGSAVQAGVGTHFNLTERFDVSLTIQYMIHLTSEINFKEGNNGKIEFYNYSHATLEGHLLTTVSVNYKIFSYGK